MLLDLTCPACGCTRRATDEVIGKVVRCPSCGGSFPVSRPEEPRPVATTPPALETAPAAPPERRPTSLPRTAPQPRMSPWAHALLGAGGTMAVAAVFGLVALVGRGRSRTPGETGTPMATAQVVARCEPSVALIRGRSSSGTGFLVGPDLLATNAHVIDDEFVDDLEVRFPSAPEGRRGPFRAELIDEDPRRDLAFLAVRCGLPPLDLAPSYRFLKGEDVLVIGSPGLGDELVLENAISRGVMSSRTAIDGQDFLQMSIPINPGNSGGPILDPAGRVIGVATLKSSRAESMGFGIPVEDVNEALVRLDLQPGPARLAAAARHRARAAFRTLTLAGALYTAALNVRADVLARLSFLGPGTDLLPTPPARAVDERIGRLERRLMARIDDRLAAIRSDATLPQAARRRYEEMASNYRAMKDLYVQPALPADDYAARAEELRARHHQLATALSADLGFPVPREHLAILEPGPPGEPPPGAPARPFPGPMRPHRGPFGIAPPPLPPFARPDGPLPFDPGRNAQARARAMQRRLDDLQRRMESLLPRPGP